MTLFLRVGRYSYNHKLSSLKSFENGQRMRFSTGKQDWKTNKEGNKMKTDKEEEKKMKMTPIPISSNKIKQFLASGLFVPIEKEGKNNERKKQEEEEVGGVKEKRKADNNNRNSKALFEKEDLESENQLQFLSKKLEENLERKKVTNVLEYLNLFRLEGHKVPDQLIVPILSFLSSSGNIHRMESFFKDMKEEGWIPTTEAYGILTQSHASKGNSEKLKRTIDEMSKTLNDRPNNQSLERELLYSAQIEALNQTKNMEGILLLFQEMKDKNIDITPNLLLSFLKSCQINKRSDLAAQFIKIFKNQNQYILPSLAHSLLIENLVLEDQIGEGLEILRNMMVHRKKGQHKEWILVFKMLNDKNLIPEQAKRFVTRLTSQFKEPSDQTEDKAMKLAENLISVYRNRIFKIETFIDKVNK
eukprot:TRINITY_DN10373_c0_g1_i1.p1 TRINITY_DN10373_c0_g1~~TRINITY_DN10373_c0_g1_i1.p1  ORF type:complete len:473 (+),score=102.03 TRINITY_DN10373_c0_g1_i1:174-1421(+)